MESSVSMPGRSHRGWPNQQEFLVLVLCIVAGVWLGMVMAPTHEKPHPLAELTPRPYGTYARPMLGDRFEGYDE